MSDAARPCPACPGTYELPEGYLDELIAAKRSSGMDLVDDSVYQSRLARCAACESLVLGGMCMKCGCYVRLRALSALRDCPHPEGDRWAV